MSKIATILGIVLVMAIMPASGIGVDIKSGLAQAYSSAFVGDIGGIATSFAGSEGDGGSLTASTGASTTEDETDILGWSEGTGESVFLGSSAYVQGYNSVFATGESSVDAEDVESGAESFSGIGDDYNFASVDVFANGIGDASGFTWAVAWQP